jgi:hypothetical protein
VRQHRSLLLSAALLVGLAGCGSASTAAAAPSPSPSGDPRISSALSAGPSVVSATATIDDFPAKAGDPYPVLRVGSGSWTCFPDDPHTPGHKMQGGSDPSMTDPFATAPSNGAQYVTTPPYLIVIPAGDPRLLTASSVPSGGGEAVMWGGTPYAHLHVPLP